MIAGASWQVIPPRLLAPRSSWSQRAWFTFPGLHRTPGQNLALLRQLPSRKLCSWFPHSHMRLWISARSTAMTLPLTRLQSMASGSWPPGRSRRNRVAVMTFPATVNFTCRAEARCDSPYLNVGALWRLPGHQFVHISALANQVIAFIAVHAQRLSRWLLDAFNRWAPHYGRSMRWRTR